MPTYLLYGPNTFASTEKRREIVKRYIEKSGAINCGTMDGKQLTIDQYRNLVLTIPLLASKRLAVVLNCLTEAKPLVREYVGRSLTIIPQDTIVVFHETKTVDRRLTLFKSLNRPGQAQEFKDWERSTTIDWLVKQASRLGGQLAAADAQYLVDRLGLDPWLLNQEIQKLITFDPKITQKTIHLLSPNQAEQSVFTIIDTLQSKNPAEFMAICDQLIRQGQPPGYLISLIGAGLRQMALVLSSPKTQSVWQLAKALRMPGFAVQKIRHQSVWNLQEISNAYRQLICLDAAIKTGTIEDRVVFDLLAIRTLQQ